MFRELWPQPAETVDVAARLGGDKRLAPAGRPWVTMVMISSLDGAITVDGLSGGLGSRADHRRFVAMRRLADVVLVGARTATAENYRPAATPIAVVSGSLSLDPGARLFSDPERLPLIYTTSQADRAGGADFDGIAEIIELGDSLELTAVLADLRDRGFGVVALEGGPTLNGHALAADVVDEILLSLAPVAVSGTAPRLAAGADLGTDRDFGVDRVMASDDMLFVRYLRHRAPS